MLNATHNILGQSAWKVFPVLRNISFFFPLFIVSALLHPFLDKTINNKSHQS